VAGWDGLLPSWWSELHPRLGTPVKALTAITVASVGIGTASLLGVGEQEAVQVGQTGNHADDRHHLDPLYALWVRRHLDREGPRQSSTPIGLALATTTILASVLVGNERRPCGISRVRISPAKVAHESLHRKPPPKLPQKCICRMFHTISEIAAHLLQVRHNSNGDSAAADEFADRFRQLVREYGGNVA
jgi:hypothetical protein